MGVFYEMKHKTIPINPEKLDEILIGIGRRKKPNPKEIKEVKVNENNIYNKNKNG